MVDLGGSGPSGPAFIEHVGDDLSITSSLKQIFCAEQSDFQRIDVVALEPWGRCLVLDAHMQSAERDEFLYHEMLVHPAMLTFALLQQKEEQKGDADRGFGAKKVFVGGGGEGATCREVLKHASVERLVMVDIDGPCVEACKKFLPGHHQGSFEDPRCEVVIDDAKAWLEQTDEKFDVIILDLADPLEEGPCVALYTKPFYEMLLTKLTPKGVVVTQSGPAGPLSAHHCFTAINNTLRGVFSGVQAHSVFVPSFVDHWGYNVAYRSADFNVRRHTAEEIDAVLQACVGDKIDTLRCIDGEFLLSATSFPKAVREALRDEKRVVTIESQVSIP